MNLANLITFGRILAIPVFILILSVDIPAKAWIAAAVFALIAATDALDGWVARKRREITTLGTFIDPLADKLLIAAALIFLIGKGVEAWMAYAIIAREFAVTGLRLIASKKGVVIAARALGKFKTVAQVIAVLWVMLPLPHGWWAMLIAVILTLVSGVEYFIRGRRLLKD